ncbi:MAG TPA: site-specific integrase [Ensifer sp.]|jgi:integrase|uniref:tyrosine-type recombinase/integrase n=1 Tax=Ensifer sp. TaxID=1872086 RepID=UPI002E0D1490|nr:site-specific integrase [Ensifer sp.]
MSVYKRKGQNTYSYDFVLRGRRFSGDIGATKKREAVRLEEARKEQANAELAEQAAFFGKEFTLDLATSRWWMEIGQHNAAPETTLKNLEWLKQHIGAKTNLTAITDSVIASLVARRRGERIKGNPKSPFVSPATVNRTCTQPLREIRLRAKNVWKVAVAEFDFGQHMLEEPQERVREASIEEEDAIMQQLERGYDDAVEFAFLSGCRRMEILGLDWPHVDFFSKRFTVTGKGGKIRTIPMSDDIFELLWKQKDHHPTKVFTYAAKRTLKKQNLVKGQRYPPTDSGLKSAMRRAVPNANVKNFRFHDTRHTAATRVLRKSNLRVAQILLGHRDIKTTTKYAHAVDDDVRNALNAASGRPTKSPTSNAAEDGNDLNLGKNSG